MRPSNPRSRSETRICIRTRPSQTRARRRPSRKEASRHELSHPTDTDLCRPAHDRGARRRVRRAQRHHQPRARGHHDLRRIHRRALRAPDAGPGGASPPPKRPGTGCALQGLVLLAMLMSAAMGALFSLLLSLRIDQPARRPDHRRHGAQPAGARAGAVLHPHHRQPEHPAIWPPATRPAGS